MSTGTSQQSVNLLHQQLVFPFRTLCQQGGARTNNVMNLLAIGGDALPGSRTVEAVFGHHEYVAPARSEAPHRREIAPANYIQGVGIYYRSGC